MAEFLCEISCEEIPAILQRRACRELKDNLIKLLDAHFKDCDLTYQSYVTPRRICLVVNGLPQKTQDINIEKRGPREDAPDQAINGFLKSNGLNDISQCVLKDTENGKTSKGKFYFYEFTQKGAMVADMLGEVICDLITNYRWASSMRFGDQKIRWVRPLCGIMAIFDGQGVKGALDLGNGESLAFNSYTYGHNSLAPEKITPKDFNDYKALCEKHYVMLSHDARMDYIKNEIESKAKALGYMMREDKGLLEEVAGLSENPHILIGSFDDRFLDLPEYVLNAVMRKHQKYFALYDKHDKIANKFAFVAEALIKDDGALVTRGNERVLKARLDDAVFFIEEDKNTPLTEFAETLSRVTFHHKLGTMQDRVERVKKLASNIYTEITNGDSNPRIKKACDLAKADLASGMVGEFPELQGKMGAYYAQQQGYRDDVCQAIEQHYLPLGPNSPTPTGNFAIALALADKMDMIAGFWSIGEKPTGSGDPYALRRAALGVIRIILDNNFCLPLKGVFGEGLIEIALENYNLDLFTQEEFESNIQRFMEDRLRQYWLEIDYRHDFIDAVIGFGTNDFCDCNSRLNAIDNIYHSGKGAELTASYKRIKNILQKQVKPKDHDINRDLLTKPQEQQLYNIFNNIQKDYNDFIKHKKYDDALILLTNFTKPLDEFFDHVMVNDENKTLKENRMKLLWNISNLMYRFANFDEIGG